MAEEIQIVGSNEIGKIRNPLGVIGLSIITFGIYGIFWYYYVNKELAAVGQARGSTEAGDNPTNSLLAVVPGVLACGIPTLVSYYNVCNRLRAADRLTGTEEPMEPALLFVLWLFIGPVAWYIFQTNMNQVLQNQAAGAQQAPAPAA